MDGLTLTCPSFKQPSRPAAPVAGFMLDSARCLESRSYYRRFIDFAADRRINCLLWHFTDDQGCSLQFERVPGIASPNAFTRAEMRELVAYARERGVEIVPELASVGHTRYLTKHPKYAHLNEAEAHFSGMCPVADETRAVVRTLLEELAEVFDGPHVHIGLDEVNIGGHPLTQQALQTKTRGQILADFAVFLHSILAPLGKRMWMWGDGLLKHAEMLQQIPRDVVICNWQYTPQGAPATTQTLLDAGFEVICCSALISHDAPIFPGERFALPNVRQLQSQKSTDTTGRVLGHICTIWTPVRFLADSLWLGVDVASAILRQESNGDLRPIVQAFAESHFGLSGPDAERFAGVGMSLLQHAPMRHDWLALLRLDRPAAKVTDRAAEWRQACDVLSDLESRVARQHDDFNATRLLFDLLHHLYDAAEQAHRPSASPATLARLLARGERLYGQLNDQWNRERFHDDPRKHTAPVASFQEDHLLPMVQLGLAKVRQLLADAAASKKINPRPVVAGP